MGVLGLERGEIGISEAQQALAWADFAASMWQRWLGVWWILNLDHQIWPKGHLAPGIWMHMMDHTLGIALNHL